MMNEWTAESLMVRCIASAVNNVQGISSVLYVSYQRLLQTISVLEAQRNQAILDLETLARHQKEALSDPIAFVDQLQKKVQKFPPGPTLLMPEMVVILSDVFWFENVMLLIFCYRWRWGCLAPREWSSSRSLRGTNTPQAVATLKGSSVTRSAKHGSCS